MLAISAALLAGSPAAAASLQLAPLPAAPPRPLVAENFCWIAGVDRTAQGVAVYFTERGTVRITAADGSQFERTYDPGLSADTPSATAEGPVMYLDVGSTFLMANAPDDACTGTVARNPDGTVSLAMTADFVIDGEADSAEEVLYAQPVSDTVTQPLADGYNLYLAWPEAVARVPALHRTFERNARHARSGLEKLTREQGTPQSEAQLPPGVTLALSETTRVTGDNDRMLSLLTEGYMFFGGAHGDSGYQALLWDRRANRQITHTAALFSDGMNSLRPAWCTALDAQRVTRSESRSTPSAGQKFGWDCPTFDELAVVPVGEPGQPFDRLRILAAPYLAGPYSAGTYDVTFPVTAEVRALVKPAYRDAFKVYSGAGR